METEKAGGVRFERVWKYYGDVPAVRDLNIDIKEGEFLVLVGPSGCGKTTSLRMLAGLETPSYGRIMMGDRDVTVQPPGARDVAMVFQSYALYPHMTVYKNLAFGPSVRREPKNQTEERIASVAEVLGLTHLLNRRPSALSGGQRQRVALGRAMIRQPKLFLLDEPLSNLDAALRVQMRTELLRLHKLLPVTTVYVTHDQVEALTMGDRLAVFNNGQLLQVGSPDELYNRPSNTFVAEFIGSPKINLIDGELAGIDGDVVTVRALGQSISIGGRHLVSGLKPGAKLRIGIRPHDLNWDAEAPARCTVRIPVTVDLMEHNGSEVFVLGDAGQDNRLMARFHRSAQVSDGDSVSFAFDPGDLHVFAAESGDSIFTADQSTPKSSDHRPFISAANTTNQSHR